MSVFSLSLNFHLSFVSVLSLSLDRDSCAISYKDSPFLFELPGVSQDSDRMPKRVLVDVSK